LYPLWKQSLGALSARCVSSLPRANSNIGIKKPKGMNDMIDLMRPALCLSILALAACDELAVANDPVALAELRATKSCIAAVKAQTGASTATLNTTLPIVEINQYVIDVPGAPAWTCFTDDMGQAAQLVVLRTG
jgi:hypothetical protein